MPPKPFGPSSQCLKNRSQYHPHTKYNFCKPKPGRRQILPSIQAVHYQFSKTLHTLHTFQTLQAAHYQFSKTPHTLHTFQTLQAAHNQFNKTSSRNPLSMSQQISSRNRYCSIRIVITTPTSTTKQQQLHHKTTTTTSLNSTFSFQFRVSTGI